MAIGRGQIPKEVEGKLTGAKDQEKKKQRVKLSIKNKKKNPIAKTFTV